MAEVDELARKRELRRRKILENAELRLKKISSAYSSIDKSVHDSCDHEDGEDTSPGIDLKNCSTSANRTTVGDADAFLSSIPLNANYSSGDSCDLSTNDSSPASVNGVYNRSPFDESYTFPKKVSDAETRSYGRTRADSRRNSSCTQLMMERLHYSYFRFSVLRPWLVLFTGLLAQICFATGRLSLSLENMFLPFTMLELGLHVWMKLDPQVSSRQSQPSVLSGALMLSGVSPSVILTVNNQLRSVKHLLLDLAIYIFSFVTLHFLFETYFS